MSRSLNLRSHLSEMPLPGHSRKRKSKRSQALLIGQERDLALSGDTIMKLAWKNQPRDARLVSARRRSTSSLGLNGMLT
jgi:hypothetical protein